MLGNSATAGIFPVDIGLAVALVNFGLKYRHQLQSSLKSKLVYKTFLLLALYAILRTGVALITDDYGYYNKFLMYGIIRWFTFVFLLIFFCQRLRKKDQVRLLIKFGWVLLFYLFFAVLHQFSVIDLSGLVETGHSSVYQSSYFIKGIYRSYLGNNSASIGFIASVGILLSLLLAGYAKWKYKAILLFTMASTALINSGSRTDSITILICFAWALIFPKSILIRFLVKKVIPVFLVIISISWFAFGDTVEIPGLTRLVNTNFIGQYHGTTDGTLNYRQIHWGIAQRYLFDNPEKNLFGFGVNGYRLLSVKGYGSMGYGHNTFMHTWVELGLIGLSLLIVWLILLLHYLFSLANNKRSSPFARNLAIITLVLFSQRILSGLTIDTFFATDNMLTMNVFILFFFGFTLAQVPQKKGITFKGKINQCHD
ncbi:MAG: hypothetical protein COA36_07445 [Desulfotalea sp.]|nr:MAG: hypothetical protein COA36_07445 [Desulfotalea sp.]